MGLTQLPQNYRECQVIDLQKDKKAFIIVNVLSVFIAVALVVLGLFISPIDLFTEEDALSDLLFPLLIALVGIIVYLFMHEAIHGVFMYAFSKVKPKFGFKSVYAYAGSTAYFNKVQYIIIALAPVVILGVALLVANFFTTGLWFWAIYLIQIMNLGGAAGDYYVTVKMRGLSKDI